MKIGEAAKETGLSISNIRFYEKKGLLEPARDQKVSIAIIQKKIFYG